MSWEGGAEVVGVGDWSPGDGQKWYWGYQGRERGMEDGGVGGGGCWELWKDCRGLGWEELGIRVR